MAAKATLALQNVVLVAPGQPEPDEAFFKPAIVIAETMGVGAHPKEIALFVLDLARKLKPLHDVLTGSQSSSDLYIPQIEKLAQIICTSMEYDTVREATALMLYHFSIYRYGILEEAGSIVRVSEQLDGALDGIEKAFGLKGGTEPTTPALAGLL